MPKVSIIMPLYNKEKYIGKTIDSVLEQTFSDYELIIINDGSTDSSMDIVAQYAAKDSRIKACSIQNGGVSNARNVGLGYASGDWIQFLDGDDTIDSDYLAKAAATAEKENVDILFSDFKKIDSASKVVDEVKSYKKGLYTEAQLMDIFMELQYKNGFFGFISNKLIRKSVIDEARAVFPTDIKLAEDLAFYVQIYKKITSCYFLPVNSFFYLQTDENYMYKDDIDYRAQLRIQRDIRDWFIEQQYDQKYKEKLNSNISSYAYFIVFHDNERTHNINKAFDDVVNNLSVYPSISEQGMSGFQKVVVKLLRKKKKKQLILLFKIRNGVRSLYRGLRKHG